MINIFPRFPNLIAKISEKSDGSMKLFDGTDVNMENRNAFFRKVGIDPDQVIGAGIANGTNVFYVKNISQKIIPDVDALVSDRKNIFLSITIADCVPIFLYESQKNIFAIAHAGWRGVAGGILKKTVSNIIEMGGSLPNIYIALGPAINACHFEVKEDVAKEFEKYHSCADKREGKIFINLKKAIKSQCDILGIKREYIEGIDECTFCQSEKYFSFRRDKPKVIEAMVAVIGVR